MLCQIVLTAVAISYVVCVLLLSGMQKEDLDANTLAKLQRHNVNIYDMNNKSLRQECLSKSNLTSAKETSPYESYHDTNDRLARTQEQSDFIIQQGYSGNRNDDTQISEIDLAAIYHSNKTNVQILHDDIMPTDNVQRQSYRNDNIPPYMNIPMMVVPNDRQMENVKNQQTMDNVINFWAKLTNRDSNRALTEHTTTYIPTEQKIIETTSESAITRNIQPKEMELINKIIAEYLGKQTEPTTTQITLKNTINMDVVSSKIKELLDNSKSVFVSFPIKSDNTHDKNLKEISDFAEFSKLFQTYNGDKDITHTAMRIPQTVTNNKNINQIKRSEIIPNINLKPKISDDESPKKMPALEYLNGMLKVNNKFQLNEPSNIPDVITSNPATKNNDAEKHDKTDSNWKVTNGNQDTPLSKLGSISSDVIKVMPALEYLSKVLKVNNKFRLNELSNKPDVITTPATKKDDLEKHDKLKVLNVNQDTPLSKVDSISIDFIKEIADKVKAIVINDIRKEIPITEKTTSPITTTSTSSTTVSENPQIKQTNESNVIQTLMEMFKELKSMQEATKGTTTAIPMKYTSKHINIHNKGEDHLYPPLIDSFKPLAVKSPVSDIKRLEVNPYKQNLMPMPIIESSFVHPPHEPSLIPQTNFQQKHEYKAPALTIQTNSAEIAPLVIKVSKPLIINQEIAITTQNPFKKQRDKKLHDDNKQQLQYKYAEPIRVFEERNHHVKNPIHNDPTEKLKKPDDVKKELISYEDKIQKIKERIERNRDRVGELNRQSHSDHQVRPRLTVDQPNSQRHNSNHYDSLNRQQDFNRHETFDRAQYNEPSAINRHETRPYDSRYHDTITREYLSRLDSNRHDIISQMVESRPHVRRPLDLDRQSRSHQSDAYERIEHERSHPGYKVPRFHEKLEEVDNRPHHNYEIKARYETDAVASRELLPLTKATRHERYDDSHFDNFLKSQLKVTDMLERILAAKSRHKQQSNESITN